MYLYDQYELQDYMIKYFKNITSEVFEYLKMCFEQKFYEVVDFKQISNTWNKPFYGPGKNL